MSRYEAKFNGGPSHGDIITLPKIQSTYNVTKVYDSGLITESVYWLVRAEGEKLFYDLKEEKFKEYSTHLERDPR
tara:strand:- start:457 stop:681 length:225 start_codon:yes stop_codon:yes gene_type:complete